MGGAGPFDAFLAALSLQAGWNAALVAVGAALLGAAGGGAGAFVFLRRRALVSDAAAHATLPGVALAFMAMVALGGDGRALAGLLAGAAASAGLGLVCLDLLVRRTRLSEDAAIGAVLSVSYGLGVVLLTVIQTLSAGRQAGLEGFLLGATAGMLASDALTLAAAAALAAGAIWLWRRPMTLVAFDPGFAAASGVDVARTDRLTMALALGVTVIGLKVVGLILVVALLIVPPAAARFWTERADRMAPIAAAIGAGAGWLGAAISAAAPDLPTGPVIVLILFAAFLGGLLLSPSRGVLAAVLRGMAFRRRVHRRQGLLALSRDEAILEPLTLRLLRREGLVHADGTPTEGGRAAAAKARLDEARWAALRSGPDGALAARYDGLTPIETVLAADEIAALDAALGRPRAAAGAGA